MVLQIANLLSPKSDYISAALDAIAFLFGRNSYCRSFVTGIGINPPMNPHDRRSGGDNIKEPWPGYLVGGSWPGAKSWTDVQDDYETNEIAINWQGALVFALAGFVNTQESGAIPRQRSVRKPADADKTVCKIASGRARVTLPAGTFGIYDYRGRLLRTLENDSQATIALEKLHLRQGLVIIKAADKR
jgi:hypothetical protein